MRKRSLISLALGFLLAALAAAQMPMPTPPPSPTPEPSPGPIIPPGYGCTDPDTGAWVPEGAMRSETTSSSLKGGSESVTRVLVCLGGNWRLFQRTTTWNTKTSVDNYPGSKVATTEGGTRNEMFDTGSGCVMIKDEVIARHTDTWTDLLLVSAVREDHCIRTLDTTDCKNPASTSHQQVDRWVKKDTSNNYANAGYTEDIDTVGYDATGTVAVDFHSRYERQRVGSDPPIPVGTSTATFTLDYYEYGKTVPHPMSYSMNYLLGGGGGGGNVWSGAAQIPQYDMFGNFVGYQAESIGQILARGKSHEYFICGSDDGSGWPWMYPGYPMP